MKNKLRSEIRRAVDDLFFWRKRGDHFEDRLVEKHLRELIDAPEIDLRPLPPRNCPLNGIPWIDYT